LTASSSLTSKGTDKTFGGEMAFRAKLEKKIAETYPIEKTGKIFSF
jgi:hypothetical protein